MTATRHNLTSVARSPRGRDTKLVGYHEVTTLRQVSELGLTSEHAACVLARFRAESTPGSTVCTVVATACLGLLLILLYVPPVARLLGHAGPPAAGFAVAALAIPAVVLADAIYKRTVGGRHLGTTGPSGCHRSRRRVDG